MDIAAFLTLVERLEAEAAADPAGYRVRVALLAALGYAYLVGMLILVAAALYALVTTTWGLGAWQLDLALLYLLYAGLRSLFIRFPRPIGLTLTRQDVPALFALIDEVCAATQAPAVHDVTLTGELNAGVAQFPRFGLLVWPRNHLVLGLPLLHALTPEQFRAVLAHEFGHLGGSHGRFGAWIYRVRLAWSRMEQHWQAVRSILGHLIFGKFLHWYAPYLNAYTFVLARAQEREADEGMCALAGPLDSGAALARLELVGRSLQPRIEAYFREQVLATEAPPEDAWRRITEWARHDPDDSEARRLLGAALAVATDVSDTHPALRDRLAVFGVPGGDAAVVDAALRRPERTAATAFLGEAEPRLAVELDELWRKFNDSGWREAHGMMTAWADRLKVLAEQATRTRLTLAEDRERIQLAESVLGEPGALPLAREAFARHPDDTQIRFHLGRLLLSQGDVTGIAHLEAVKRADPSAAEAVSALLFRHHWELGATEEAEAHRRRAAEEQVTEERLQRERGRLPAGVRVEPHGLPAEQVDAIRWALYQLDDLEAVHCVRRRVRYHPERPCWIVVVARQRSLFEAPMPMETQAHLLRVANVAPWPPDAYFFKAEDVPTLALRRIRRVDGAELLSTRVARPLPPGKKDSLAVVATANRLQRLGQRRQIRAQVVWTVAGGIVLLILLANWL